MSHTNISSIQSAVAGNWAAGISAGLWAAVLLSGIGCAGEGGSPSARVVQPRILAVQAEPPVVALGQDAAMTPLLAGVDGSMSVDWSFRACSPWIVISDPTSDCSPEESLALDPDTFASGDGAWLRPTDVLAAFPPPDWWQPGSFPQSRPDDQLKLGGTEPECGMPYESVDVTVVAEAHIRTDGGDDVRLLATKRVRVTFAPVGRRNPVIENLTLNEELTPRDFTPGAQYTLIAAPRQDSLDLLCNDDGQAVLEPVTVFIYISAGQIEDPAIDVEYSPEGQETAGSTVWTAPDQGDASLWLVAIDGDGGIGWRQIDMTAAPE